MTLEKLQHLKFDRVISRFLLAGVFACGLSSCVTASDILLGSENERFADACLVAGGQPSYWRDPANNLRPDPDGPLFCLRNGVRVAVQSF